MVYKPVFNEDSRMSVQEDSNTIPFPTVHSLRDTPEFRQPSPHLELEIEKFLK